MERRRPVVPGVMRLGVAMALLAVNTAPLYAQAPVAAPIAGGPTQIGVAAAVRGRVELSRAGAVGRIVQSGQPVFLGDVIKTDAQGSLQVLLADETVFTIGQNSAITIDEFVYDPSTNAGKVSASVVKGVFRFVTGKVAHQEPKAMQVKLPTGLIGIRGTIVAGRCEGEKSLVVLLGPGPKNNSGEPPGQITVGNTVGGILHEVTVTRPGYGTEIVGAEAPPTPPAPVPPAELSALTESLEASSDATAQETAPEATAATTGDESAAELAGEAFVEYLADFSDVESLSDLTEEADDESNQAAQDAADESNVVADGISTKDQLRTIDTGQFHFTSSGSFTQTKKTGSPSNIVGTISGSVDLDFGARTIGGGNSKVTIDTSSAGGNILRTETIEAQSFASGSGNAVFTDTSSDSLVTGSITLNNSGGVVGKTANLSATFDNTGHTSPGFEDVGSSSISNVERTSGLSP